MKISLTNRNHEQPERTLEIIYRLCPLSGRDLLPSESGSIGGSEKTGINHLFNRTILITGQTECYYLSDKFSSHKNGTKFLYLDIKQSDFDSELYVKAKKPGDENIWWLAIENLFFPEHVELTEINNILNLD